jgi:hypothetical protein
MKTIDQVLDAVMELTDEQQDMLLDIMQHRRLEARRREIADAAYESLALFQADELKPEPVKDIIRKLRLTLQGQAD